MKRFPMLSLLMAAALFAAGCASTSETTAPPEPEPEQPEAPPEVVVPEQPEPPEEPDEEVYRGVALDTVEADRFDKGRMWTFEHPPTEYFEETYGFNADEEWFQHARLGALRIPGCSASFVSPNGLVLTNHHCARSHVADVSRTGEDLVDNGFTAPDMAAERVAPDMYADQLIALRDVTEEVSAALDAAQTDAERQQVREDAYSEIRDRLADEFAARGETIHVEINALYNGAVYSAYIFRRYENIRLVMAPELQIGYFGGDTDNFTYPRYALDMALFRVYDDQGNPLDSENYFEWSENGATVGDAVFVIGNPGSTSRLSTVAQLEFRRDVSEPAILHLVESRAEAMDAYLEANPGYAEATALRNQVFSFLNAAKFYTGTLEGLRDSVLLARIGDAQDEFMTDIEEDPQLRMEYGDLEVQLADIQQEKRAYASQYRAFAGLSPGSPFTSSVLGRAMVAYNYLQRSEAGAPSEALQQLEDQFISIPEQPDGLARRLLTVRLMDIEGALGAETDIVEDLLQGRSPAAAARAIVSGSVLADSAEAVEALQEGTLTMDDPAIEAAAAFMPRLQEYQSAFGGLNAREQELARQFGKARFEIFGTDVPPDATFSLRISDGVVRGYEYNGTFAPPHTTFYGMYGHYHSYGEESAWDLPERWLPPPDNLPDNLNLSTPLNLVSTNDIIGGNSGSPLVNSELEIVGVAFDLTIEGLISDYIYLPERGSRTVSVDSRGMIEALDTVYDMDRIVLELKTGELYETEEAADAAD